MQQKNTDIYDLTEYFYVQGMSHQILFDETFF